MGIVPPIPYKLMLRRAPLVALGAVLAHLLPWNGLRAGITTACVALSHAMGMEVTRLSADTFSLPGWPMRIATSCTMIDVYLAALPLLWSARRGWLGNLRLFVTFFAGLMAFNVVRLVAGFWLFTHGLSWLLAHEVFAGFVLFAVFEWICRKTAREGATEPTDIPLPA